MSFAHFFFYLGLFLKSILMNLWPLNLGVIFFFFFFLDMGIFYGLGSQA